MKRNRNLIITMKQYSGFVTREVKTKVKKG